jgi:glycosyltransferase involved in cell wall biosynthesis
MMTNTISELPTMSREKSGWPWSGITPVVAHDHGQPLPKISVITFAHNQSALLEATIRSVLLQGYPNLEYIVIDSGSTDDSLEIIKQYEPWITHRSSANDPAHALIDAFHKASGDILSWLNAGDLYAPDALQIAARRLTSIPKGLLVGSTIFTHSPETLDGEIISRWPIWEKMVYETITFPQASVFWTRDLWEAASAGLGKESNLALDYYLWLQMFCHASTFIPEAIVLSYSRTQFQWTEEQQAYAAVAAAKQRGENLPLWLIKLWLYRIRLALWKRKWKMLTGSRFHQIATRLVLLPRRYYTTS